ncbi:MAG TPA: TonB-dependent receptor [Terriglobales bacterium]|nr:TonB-dependent receptor [Terriglobales bacterium]
MLRGFQATSRFLTRKSSSLFVISALVAVCFVQSVSAQSRSYTSVSGTVVDPTGAVVPGATVEIRNPVSQFERSVTTDNSGTFSIPNIPFNPYHMTVIGKGFAPYAEDVDLRSPVPYNLKVSLQMGTAVQTVTVESNGADLIENDPTFHTDVDRMLFDKLPLESASSSVSSLVTLASPGIAADSNGLFHGIGDHAENSFSVDGQPITDQQSKVFSNQIPLDSVQSLEVIGGAPPAEFGDKTSVVIQVTTRSGLGSREPHGAVTASYGTFGTATGGFNLAYGGDKAGNYIAVNGLNTGRFLDPPEFSVMHDRGNEENVFDRLDFKFSDKNSLQLNLGFTRSWFQQPNSFDAQFHPNDVNPITGGPLGPADQRAQITTFNIAPSWTRLLSSNAVFTLGAFVRRDQFNYYPSANPFNDLEVNSSFDNPSLTSSISQDRNLTNAGLRTDLNYTKGIHNLKIGATYMHTFLNEKNTLGIVDPNYLANTFGCPNGNPAPDPCAVLPPFDLTAGGQPFTFKGHTDVKELALYVQDAITKGSWTLNLGLRGDFYNGLTTHQEAEPRIGLAYNIKRTNTILRASYARLLETPFNENLIVSSVGCADAVLNPLLGCSSSDLTPLRTGWRNEFHAGIEQAFGKYLVASGEYITKYTHNAYDFSILGNTPIFFPIGWVRSKIPAYAGRVSVPNFHGFSALVVMSSVSARFFNPQVSGAGATPSAPGGVFRIDHDEKFNSTAHFQYQVGKTGPWLGFNWRYDSGLVAGAVPFAPPDDPTSDIILTGLTADQQFQAGFFCGSQRATLSTPLTSCAPSQFGSTLVSIPAPGTEDDDKNPPRISPRHLFDVSLGDDNLFRGDKYKWSLQLTAINITNKYALYNFLSTFSGTHYVTPRSLVAQLGFHF